ncbi:hypothetical protein O6H91_13G082600 [Diphasiastrum complanatum]|uniref:Uncharacterized protein n=1 Tax=Diphasiastrum complanatum TaxID=34168 RepID=A0ACC2BWP2_DIPCM|nr:hypothetical protein O6H91_Y165300 [Diphasiastrum complanatum]KAJ7534179.1 hypothetical protein O6H91_13G082600 [Diphasiastrum complanatum]
MEVKCIAKVAIIVASLIAFTNLLANGNQILSPGFILIVGNYNLTMQYDCNFVLYDIHGGGHTAISASDTANAGQKCFAQVSDNGNIGVYNGIPPNTPLWIRSSTNVNCPEYQYRINLSMLGNICVVCSKAIGSPILQTGWCSNTGNGP